MAASAVMLSSVALQGSALAADMPAAAPKPVAAAPFFLFSDTVLEFRYEAEATDPGLPNKFGKEIANITHVDAFKYGTNFISADVLQSTSADPTEFGNNFAGAGSSAGARELYFIYRGTLSGNAVTNSKKFSYGFLKDVSLSYGTDLETSNQVFGPEKTALVVGPQFSFDVPGLLTISPHYYHEWNHNGIAQGLGLPSNSDFNTNTGDVSFKSTFEVEVVYLQPLQKYTGLPLTFSGFTNVILPKGKDGFGNNTKTEVLTSNRLTLDAGSYFQHPKFVDLFVGYKFWYNKFGNTAQFGNPAFTQGSYENTVFAGIDIHLQ